MANYSFRIKTIIGITFICIFVIYINYFYAYFSRTQNSYPEIVEISSNSVNKNFLTYEKNFMQARESLPATGVIGYAVDCYKYGLDSGDKLNSLKKIDYDCLAKIYIAQYTLAPLVLVRSNNPTIIF
jgi:hypothetical protein